MGMVAEEEEEEGEDAGGEERREERGDAGGDAAGEGTEVNGQCFFSLSRSHSHVLG